ncbi:hypothetical protein OESDEN_14040 [Oesophagostomum dentatum]|uniref:Uncharacterized protein n=1 Tax=Oesophagostomum dentatum TaxID=61180 RepID=A0A0B1SLN7_OESDE|nr:hypothetical protein OESDEN_14040 [Oesophagostomum dentatum]
MRAFFVLALILTAVGVTILPTLQLHHPDSSEPGHPHSSEEGIIRSRRFAHWGHGGHHWLPFGDMGWWGHGYGHHW